MPTPPAPAPVSAEASTVTSAPSPTAESTNSAEPVPAAPSQGLVEMLKGEGMIIVGLTVLSYFAAYWFKVGEYLAHDISPRLIRIELIDSLRAGGHLGIALALVLMCCQMVRRASEVPVGFGRLVRFGSITGAILVSTFVVCGILLGMTATEIISHLLNAIIYVVGYIVVCWVLALMVTYVFFGRSMGVLAVTKHVVTRTKSGTLFREVVGDMLHAKITITVLAVVAMAFFVYLYGFTSARRQTTFTRLEGTPYVVIDTLNDRLLCKSVNEKQDGLLPGFTLVPMREGEVMSFVSLKLNKKDENTPATAAVPEPSKPEPASPAASKATPADPAATVIAPAPPSAPTSAP